MKKGFTEQYKYVGKLMVNWDEWVDRKIKPTVYYLQQEASQPDRLAPPSIISLLLQKIY